MTARADTLTADLDGTTIAYDRGGSGPPLILVHGLGGPPMWERVLPILRQRFDVVLPHLPGFGGSPPTVHPPSVTRHVEVLSRLLDSLSIARLTVTGISFGGRIAVELAAGRPGLVDSLVLVCPTGTKRYPPVVRSAGLRGALRPVLRRALANPRVADALSRRSFHDPGTRPADLVARHLEHLELPGRMDAFLATVDEILSDRGDLGARIRDLRMPVSLVWGEHDRTVPAPRADTLAGRGGNVELTVIPSSGHSVPLERPGELAAAIVRAAGRGR